jgi:hypothetical protein
MNPASADRNEQNVVTVRGGRVLKSPSSRLPDCWRGASSSTLREGRHGGARAARGPDQVRLQGGRSDAGEGVLAGEGGRAREGRFERAGGHAGRRRPVKPPAATRLAGQWPEAEVKRQGPACAAACSCCLRCLPWATSAPGFFSITETIKADQRLATRTHLDWAAIAILFAIPFRRAGRAHCPHDQHHCSEFGKELDSLADAITFGVAPSLLALIWGFHFLPDSINPQLHGASVAGRRVHLFSVSDWRRFAAGAVQHFARCAAAQSRTAGAKVFCGDADSGGGGFLAATVHFATAFPVSRGGSRFRGSAGGPQRFPHGEHLAVLVGQGDQLLAQPSLPDCCLCWPLLYVMLRSRTWCCL